MQINDAVTVKQPPAANVAPPSAGAAKAAEQAAATSAGTENVRLSSQGKALASVGSNGVFDAKKVEQIKAAIASGAFKVDAGKIADGLIDSVKEFAPKRK